MSDKSPQVVALLQERARIEDSLEVLLRPVGRATAGLMGRPDAHIEDAYLDPLGGEVVVRMILPASPELGLWTARYVTLSIPTVLIEEIETVGFSESLVEECMLRDHGADS
jgi:hypothetical protein